MYNERNNQLMNESNDDGSGTSVSSGSLPQILTRNSYLPSLSNLDASDVIECYTLTRSAKLENGLMVRKSALAFRFVPKSSSPDVVVKDPFELTLEYGPQRTGATQTFESMPSINGKNRDLDDSGDGMYVSWENHAKIYYSLSISDHDWENAYYMAPITGAVLTKVLSDYILDYTEEHPRYQPFTVLQTSGKVVLKSSNSDDFVWNVFNALSQMYVSIKPILSPKRYSLELHVEDVKRDVQRLESGVILDTVHYLDEEQNNTQEGSQRKQNVANAAAEFYSKLFLCLDAIKTGDYSHYQLTEKPTSSPSHQPSFNQSHPPSSSPTVYVKATGKSTQSPSQEASNDTRHTHDRLRRKRRRRVDEVEFENNEDAMQNIDQDENLPSNIDDVYKDDDYEEDNGVLPFMDNANAAAEEAEKAAQMVKEATESIKNDEAMVAASQAVEAAKKAAFATSQAAAETATESLLSGDGKLMTNVINQCFSDPKYGIQRENVGDNNSSQVSTDIFLYVDGSHYYKLNITSPFLKISEFSPTLPTADTVPNGKSDIIDIGLALTIVVGLIFGFIVLLHQIKVINWDHRLQFRWFFQPHASDVRKKGQYSNAPLEDIHDLHLFHEENGNVEMSGALDRYHARIPSTIENMSSNEMDDDNLSFSNPVVKMHRTQSRSSQNGHV